MGRLATETHTSKAVRSRDCSEGLARLKVQFEQWRAGCRRGERIPLELGGDAMAAVGEHGAYRVAAELRLDYVVLKRRTVAGGKARGTEVAPRFVELFGTAAAATWCPQRVVEMANAHRVRPRPAAVGGQRRRARSRR